MTSKVMDQVSQHWKSCPMCAGTTWGSISPKEYQLLPDRKGGAQRFDEAMIVTPFLCMRCGFVAFAVPVQQDSTVP